MECYYKNVKFACHLEVKILKNRLEEIRKQKGLTQEELAEKLEVSRQTISSLESGRYNPSILLAFKIAKMFDLSIEDIFIYEEEPENEK
jgi:putative transcriptional regulator